MYTEVATEMTTEVVTEVVAEMDMMMGMGMVFTTTVVGMWAFVTTVTMGRSIKGITWIF